MEQVTMTIKDAAHSAGVGTRTIYNWIYGGQLASVKVGGRRLVRKDSFLQLLSGEGATDGQ